MMNRLYDWFVGENLYLEFRTAAMLMVWNGHLLMFTMYADKTMHFDNWQILRLSLRFTFDFSHKPSIVHTEKEQKRRNLCVKYSPSASIRFSLYCSFVLFLFTEISSINCNYRIFNKRACISYLIFSFIFIF